MLKARINADISLGDGEGLLFIAGPCVLESRDVVMKCAEVLKALSEKHCFRLLFKSSFDKANRSSIDSYRGPGIDRGLALLHEVKKEFGLPLISDIHETGQVGASSEVLDVLQIPAFLCRQTDLLLAAGESGRCVNIKKGQFMAPQDIYFSVEKVKSTGNENVFVTERGTTFGYHNLVVDMRSIPTLKQFAPVVFDATHSVQLPGGMGGSSGGEREYALPLARAAIAAGADGIFMEVHPDPEKALCDGPNSLPLDSLENFLPFLVKLRKMMGEH